MNNKNNNLIKGSIGLIAIIVAAVLIIGGVFYFIIKKSPTQRAAEVEIAVSDISASIPSLDFGASPLPDLNISSLNVGVAQSNVSNIFSAPTVNTDFSYQSNLDINLPSVSSSDFNFQMPSIPADIPTSNSNVPTTQGGETPPSAGNNQPSVDCSAFASVPSCSMTGPGEAMCKQCFPNK
ncbi:MAG: hypothetical protein PHD31_01420 [Candidatus Pacebacteria bacterium]|nr:hypothetical protein [Candidatus Paceibacterota bacterium]